MRKKNVDTSGRSLYSSLQKCKLLNYNFSWLELFSLHYHGHCCPTDCLAAARVLDRASQQSASLNTNIRHFPKSLNRRIKWVAVAARIQGIHREIFAFRCKSSSGANFNSWSKVALDTNAVWTYVRTSRKFLIFCYIWERIPSGASDSIIPKCQQQHLLLRAQWVPHEQQPSITPHFAHKSHMR
jgi:hypothetical protein